MMGVIKRASGLQTALLLVRAECFVAFCRLWKKKDLSFYYLFYLLLLFIL